MKFVGSALGAEVGSDVDFSQYWYESLCSTVRFDQAVVAAPEGRGRHVRRVVRAPLVAVSACRTGRRGVGGHRRVGASRRVHHRCAVGEHRRRRERRSRLPLGRCDCPPMMQPLLRGFPNAPMRAVHLWAAPQPATDNAPDPATALTVAVEDWQQAALPTTASGTRCGIAIAGDAAGTLAQRLTDAVAAHRWLRRRTPERGGNRRGDRPSARPDSTPTAAIEQIAGQPRRGICRTTPRSSVRDAEPSGCLPLAANGFNPTTRMPGPRRRRWPRCTAASASSSRTRLSAASTCRREMSMARLRLLSSTCCSVMPP